MDNLEQQELDNYEQQMRRQAERRRKKQAGAKSTLEELLRKTPEFEFIDIDLLGDAPKAMDFFAKDSRTIDTLAANIKANGLIEPIIVRKLTFTADNGQSYDYQILAGHTRVRAYKKLRAEANNDNKYNKIKAIVLTITHDEEAQAIICDTNYEKRKLSSAEKAKCIYIKIKSFKARPEYLQLENSAERNEKIVELLKSSYGIEKSTAYSWNKIACFEQELFNFIFEKGLSIRSAEKLASLKLSIPEQHQLLNMDAAIFSNSKIAQLKKGMSLEKIEQILCEGSGIKVQKFGYSLGDIRKETDKPALVFVDEAKLTAFEEYLKGFDGAYLVKTNLDK